jgi:hypothetical protein
MRSAASSEFLEPQLLRGTKAISAFLFGDADQWRKVYPLTDELGLFKLRGFLCGRPQTIRERLAAREATERHTAPRQKVSDPQTVATIGGHQSISAPNAD